MLFVQDVSQFREILVPVYSLTTQHNTAGVCFGPALNFSMRILDREKFIGAYREYNPTSDVKQPSLRFRGFFKALPESIHSNRNTLELLSFDRF